MHDICIIGGGPGGYVSAIKAAQLGLKVILIEKEDNLGGVCLNQGCIPTKSLLHCGKIAKYLKNSSEIGIEVDSKNINFNLQKMVSHSKNTINTLSSGIKMLMKKNKIEVIKGFAKFLSNNQIVVEKNNQNNIEKTIVNAKYFVIATGSRARTIPSIKIDEEVICTAKGALNCQKNIDSVLIVGGGVIGIEFASFFASIGKKVTVIEVADNILNTEDKEIRNLMMKTLQKDFEILTSASIKELIKVGNKAKITFLNKDKEEIIKEFDLSIIAIGIIPNSDEISLEKTSVKKDEKGFIISDKCLTNCQNIYAIGDVTLAPWLAHKASHEGIFVAEDIAYKLGLNKHKPKFIKANNIPSCIYSFPQVASIGKKEEELIKENIPIKIGRFSANGNGKALASLDNNAFIKIIFHKNTGEILGCHIIGNEASEIIHSIALAKQAELIDLDFIHTVFPHPTISEMLHEAVLNANNCAIHG